MGVRNRLQTKRDALTFNWLEVDTFFQVNAYDPGDVQHEDVVERCSTR